MIRHIRCGSFAPARLAELPRHWNRSYRSVGRIRPSFSSYGDQPFVSPLVGCFVRHQSTADSGKAVVMSKRLPEDFVDTTLMPHLESQLLEHVHTYTPASLANIARAYSRQSKRQYVLCLQLADAVMDRIKGFEAVDIVDILGALWILLPSHDKLFTTIEKRILEKIDDFTALNLMGLARIYNKRAQKHHELLGKILPRLRKLLINYETVELIEMLASMAQTKEAVQDMDILMTFVPEVERRIHQVSLLHAINTVWSLTKLGINHPRLLDYVAKELSQEQKTRDLTAVFLARIAWIYRRCNAWDQVSEFILPLIRAASSEFKCGEFARLSQALPDEHRMLSRISDLLRLEIDDMGRKDFMLFALGCVQANLLEDKASYINEPTTLVGQIFAFIREEQDYFKRDEVQKLVYMLSFSPRYKHFVDELPASWNTTKQETLDFIAAQS